MITKNKIVKALLKLPLGITSILGSLIGGLFFTGKNLFTGNFGALGSPQKKISGFADQIAEQVERFPLQPITLAIKSQSQHKIKRIHLHFKEGKKKIKPVRHKVNGTTYYYFKLYLLPYGKQDLLDSDEVSAFKPMAIPSSEIHDLGLYFDSSVKNPTAIDGNLNPGKKRLAIENNYDDKLIIQRIEVHSKYGYTGDINRAIKDKNSSLFYSLKNARYHVNPILENDLDPNEKVWIFRENTNSLDQLI